MKQSKLAVNAFMKLNLEIGGMLERLSELSNEHFNVSPDDVDWGHVGTLEHYKKLLEEITESSFIKYNHPAS